MTKCCICEQEIIGHPCNPDPFPGEACCSGCDNNLIIPVRIHFGRNFYNPNVLNMLKTIRKIAVILNSKETVKNLDAV